MRGFEAGYKVVRGRKWAVTSFLPGEWRSQQREAVQRPVQDPRAAGIERHKAARELTQGAAKVPRVCGAVERQRVVLSLHLHMQKKHIKIAE
jgi:hypothetical protein